MTELLHGLHFDPVSIALLVVLFIYGRGKKDQSTESVDATVKANEEWIKGHQEECTEFKKMLAASISKLTTLAETHEKRLDKMEDRMEGWTEHVR